MTTTSTIRTAVVVPNWNGKHDLPMCLDSLLGQIEPCEIIVVENGSNDGSLEFLQQNYPNVTVLPQTKNLGFAGGVNVGIRYAIENGYPYVALFNNDAVANNKWLSLLTIAMDEDPEVGIVTGKFTSSDELRLDSTGDIYTTWGLPYPRGRDETDLNAYDNDTDIFGATGGASLYRAEMLREIGLFDEDFFAYYEDVDISFRAQLAGWKVRYVPQAIAYHQIGATSGKIKGFTTYQTLKNLPWVLWKNVPFGLLPVILPRFTIAYTSFVFSALARRQFLPVLKGLFVSLLLLPKKLFQRFKIQQKRKVSTGYIRSIITWDLPPNAKKIRKLRSKFQKFAHHNNS